MAHKPTELRPIMTRIPERLRLRLEREAKRNERSMNAEICLRLEQSFALKDLVRAVEQAVRRAILREFEQDAARATLEERLRAEREKLEVLRLHIPHQEEK